MCLKDLEVQCKGPRPLEGRDRASGPTDSAGWGKGQDQETRSLRFPPLFFKLISQLKPRQDQVPRSHSSGVQRCQGKSGERKLIETFFFLKELHILVLDWRVLC